jgi:molybdate transport system substrate-binding protein
MRPTTRLLALLLAALGTLATACGDGKVAPSKAPDASAVPHQGSEQHGGQGDGTGEHKAEARIYAAASLTEVVQALAREFEPQRGSHVVASFGASGTLAEQLRQGAPPGVFVAADAESLDALARDGLVEEGSRVDLASNSLVVIVPKDAEERPATLAELADAKFSRIALADPVAVPAGRYAKAALEKAGVFEQVRGRVVAAQDVRTALSYVERGEAGAGIVYSTDAAASGKVSVAFRVPSEMHPRIVYPMVLVKGANRRAHELHEFLKSEKAWPAFEKAGFTKP